MARATGLEPAASGVTGRQVVCVTYETNGMQTGEVVTFDAGFASRGKEWLMLDPCLASRRE